MQEGVKGSCTKLVLKVLTVPGRRTKLLPQESVGEFCCFLVLHQNRWCHLHLGCRREVTSLIWWVASLPTAGGLELNDL